MDSLTFSALKFTAALGVAASLAFPVAASAQQPYEQPPPYAQPQQTAQSYCSQTAIKGTISSFDGQWIVYMRDDKGYTDHITLHQGTVINPTGIKLLEGMRVSVCGYASGSTFQANQINVAYSPYSPYYGSNGQPVGGDYGYGDAGYGYGDAGYGSGPYGYGYPGYGYGYGAYPYFGVGINWGWGWGWGWPGWGWGYPGWGYGGYCCGYGYGGGYYPYYPYYPYRHGPYYPGRHGQMSAPGTFRGGMRAPVSGGTMHAPAGGGMRAPVSGGMHSGGGRPPRS